jgi:carbon storage regulator CsrA
MLANAEAAASHCAMLVLTRGLDEGIVIGDNIRVTVVRVTGGVVRIGIEAPKDATILRGEFLEAQRAADKSADATARRP